MRGMSQVMMLGGFSAVFIGLLLTKPIPRWDVHFGVLKMTERTPQPLVSPLGPNWVGTDSAV